MEPIPNVLWCSMARRDRRKSLWVFIIKSVQINKFVHVQECVAKLDKGEIGVWRRFQHLKRPRFFLRIGQSTERPAEGDFDLFVSIFPGDGFYFFRKGRRAIVHEAAVQQIERLQCHR